MEARKLNGSRLAANIVTLLAGTFKVAEPLKHRDQFLLCLFVGKQQFNPLSLFLRLKEGSRGKERKSKTSIGND
jgi:hypothetical protein